MKKVLVTILAIMIAATFVTGCKKGKGKSAKKEPKKTAQKAPMAQPPAETPATQAPAGAPTPSTQAVAPQPPQGAKPVAAKPGAVKPSTQTATAAPAPATPTAGATPTPVAAPVAGQPPTAGTDATANMPVAIWSYSTYRPDGKKKRSPFFPITVEIQTPPMMYEISQLGVNGVILHGVKQASVMTPSCVSTIMKVGDPIGIHGGQVVDISLEGVKVRETYLDQRGVLQEYERTIENRPYECK